MFDFDMLVLKEVKELSEIIRLIKYRKHETKVSLEWLWRNLPVEYWLWFFSSLVGVFLLGIVLGQIHWVRDLLEW
jgi:hypothetical protein